mmetsp:Transcript_2937/g.4277  ORF Transcript_2937/g.4277 Transcript_2937/m.4277 type:complete len:129 (-) Transcript_2937:994-1380(-)
MLTKNLIKLIFCLLYAITLVLPVLTMTNTNGTKIEAEDATKASFSWYIEYAIIFGVFLGSCIIFFVTVGIIALMKHMSKVLSSTRRPPSSRITKRPIPSSFTSRKVKYTSAQGEEFLNVPEVIVDHDK